MPTRLLLCLRAGNCIFSAADIPIAPCSGFCPFRTAPICAASMVPDRSQKSSAGMTSQDRGASEPWPLSTLLEPFAPVH